ncbi:MAG: S1/P1 nuclease [Flavobacteriaceae bacterium]|nr:S1/P1 nuclease [Flavobacteriaceae bacterium]
MKYLLLFLFCFSSLTLTSFSYEDWGKTGHRATGEVAQKHLSRKAKRAIDKLLDGQSLAFVSNYGDDIKSDDAYRSYGPWHYVNFPFDKTYNTHPKSEKGDLVAAINTCVSILKSKSSTKDEKVFHLKMLVHFIGDLHQPLHVGKADDKGANDFQVLWFNEGTNLHSVWDTKMIESYNMSYSELAANTKRLSGAQLKHIMEGDVQSWMAESRTLCLDIYANTKAGEKLGYRYMYKYINVARFQMQKGGIRLAVLLNDIFN